MENTEYTKAQLISVHEINSAITKIKNYSGSKLPQAR